MDRILDLQKLATTAQSDTVVAGSSSSWVGCACSTSSVSGCSAQEIFVAV